jgi:3'-phosphoadenosine 5'-phosphosulfate sulfotransferase (PAPS reductase)/FAD synthetase
LQSNKDLFAPGFVNYKKGCIRLTAASDQAYQLLAHGRWFSPASSTTKIGRHDIAEILLKV